MAKYFVKLTAPTGHSIPPLLQSFGTWLAKQPHGSVGYFELHVENVETEWNPEWTPEFAKRFRREGYSFLGLPDGSSLVLLQTSASVPPAVVLLGSEGETDTVATSLEEFLLLLGTGETGLDDLDDEEATGRSRLRTWLAKNKVQAPKAPPFDFDAYLDGVSPAIPSAEAKSEPTSEVIAGLPPLIHKIASLMGRRADDAELIDFVTNELGKKIPNSKTDMPGLKYVVAPKKGIELGFDHDIKNVKYPLSRKSKNSYVPYLKIAWLKEKIDSPLPFGLTFGMSDEEITNVLGPPTGYVGTVRRALWERVLDPTRDIEFSLAPGEISISPHEARELASPDVVGRPVLGLFVAWALFRDLLEPEPFRDHAALLAAVRKCAEKGSTFLDTALPRGLWDVHLKDEPDLRNFAFGWFHNIGGSYIRDDLVTVFGARKGPYGHDEPVLDDDNWSVVDRATPTLDRRFGQWVKKTTKKTGRKS